MMNFRRRQISYNVHALEMQTLNGYAIWMFLPLQLVEEVSQSCGMVIKQRFFTHAGLTTRYFYFFFF